MKLHGCTVHLVTQQMDEGPILAQAAVPVLDGDTEDTLADRVLAQEHVIYPAALAAFASGRAAAVRRGGRGAAQPARRFEAWRWLLPDAAGLP